MSDMAVPTIGLLITDITRTWTIQQWSGVMDAARRRGANLITFETNTLSSPYGFDAQSNILFQLARSERINGLLVWTEGLVTYVTPAEISDFFARYSHLPVVSAEHAIEGVPNVLNDDFGAMRSMITHLVEVHGYRRIAYIKHATPLHRGVNERYRAYVETLAEHGIPFDPALVSPPIDAEAPPVHLLLSEWMQRGHAGEWDAIVAHNDLVALRVQQGLRSLGLAGTRVPAVTGVDDSEEGAVTHPSLTTIRPPFREMGSAAVDILLDMIEGKQVDQTRTLQGELVIRRSCGCMDPATVEVGKALKPAGARESSPTRTGAARGKKTHGGTPRGMSQSRSLPAVVRRYINSVIDTREVSRRQLVEDLIDGIQGSQQNSFIQHLEAHVNRMPGAVELAAFGRWLSELRGVTVPLLDGELLRRAAELFHQAQALIGGEAQQQQRRRVVESLHREAVLRKVETALFMKFSVTSLMDELAASLPRIGVHGFALSLYEDPRPYAYPDDVPEHSRLVLAFHSDRRFNLPDGGLPFPTRQLVPPHLWPSSEPFNLVATALYFQDQQLGFALFDVGPREGVMYESLRAVISNDLQGARLVEQEQRWTRQLQENERERRQLESMLHRAQKLEAVGQLAGGVAHEFNNILTAIMGFSSILMMSMAKDDPRRDLVERTIVSCRRAADLAQQMLILGQKDSSNPSAIDLNDAVRSSFGSLAGQLGQKIELTFDPWRERLPVLADGMRVQQILANLAANSRDAMPLGGTVAIRLSCERIDPSAKAPDLRPGMYAHLAFSDTGTGMDESTRARLFEPFFTTKDVGKGTGLGLATVWAIVEQDHGFITVTSQIGRGTTFDIFLPLHHSEERPEERSDSIMSLHGTETVLVADGSGEARHQVRSILEEHGYSVIEAANGEDAARHLAEHTGRAHLALLDTMIAKVDIWEVAMQLQKHAPDIKIVFMSEYAPSRFGIEPLRIDHPRFLSKPFTTVQLLEKVRKVLDE
jgi:signal transduction histidine kinase/DNA-binding LacI/PurR family transcriptional regulator/CheY-like chemotaxis protein